MNHCILERRCSYEMAQKHFSIIEPLKGEHPKSTAQNGAESPVGKTFFYTRRPSHVFSESKYLSQFNAVSAVSTIRPYSFRVLPSYSPLDNFALSYYLIPTRDVFFKTACSCGPAISDNISSVSEWNHSVASIINSPKFLSSHWSEMLRYSKVKYLR